MDTKIIPFPHRRLTIKKAAREIPYRPFDWAAHDAKTRKPPAKTFFLPDAQSASVFHTMLKKLRGTK